MDSSRQKGYGGKEKRNGRGGDQGGDEGGRGGGGGGKRKFSTGLKTKDQIMKERNRKEKIKNFQKKKQSSRASKGWKNKRSKSKR